MTAAHRIALIVPSSNVTMETELPADRQGDCYLADAGIEAVDAVSHQVTDNQAVGRLDPRNPLRLLERLDLRRAEALVLSACVQIPSLAAIEAAENLTGLPTLSAATLSAATLSAATATAAGLLATLEPEPVRI